MTDRVGQQIGNYRLIRLLGKGGFAEVYLGEHKELGTQAAIKILQTALLKEETEKFRREARTIANLIYPHIIRVFDYGVEGSTPFMVMDYASGGTLKDRHTTGVQLPLPTVASYVKQVAEGLQYAHDKKIIHRDIKPANLLVGRHNEILLSDFGIAVIAHSTHSMILQDKAGTLAYMAPEQLQGKPAVASDQYALGIVVYEWLCGEVPFKGSVLEILTQHLSVLPPLLHTKIPTIPPDVEQVVLKSLAKDPNQRFATVRDFAQALEQAGQRDQTTSPTTPFEGSSVLLPLQQSPVVPAIPHAASPLLPALPTTETPPVGTILYSYENKQFARFCNLAWSPDGSQIGFCVMSPAKGYRKYLAGIWDITAEQDRRKSFLSFFSTKPLLTRGRVFTYPDSSSYPIVFAWSPDGTQIAFAGNLTDDTGGYANVVHLWSIPKENKLLSYSGHFHEIQAVAWSPDGTHIASMEGQGMLYVWNTRTRHATYTHQFHSAYRSILSLRSEAKEPIWLPCGLQWLPQGLRLVFATEWLIEVREATTGEKLSSFEVRDFPLSHDLHAVAWSPDGKYIAIAIWKKRADSERTSVHIWNVATGKQIFTYNNHSGFPRDLAWSPDGNRIASACDDGIQVWNAFTGTDVFTYRHPVWCLAWSPDGKYIASSDKDGMVHVWQAV